MIPTPSQYTVAVCNQITFLVLYCVSSRLVTFLKVTEAPTHFCHILILTVCFKLINFSFQMFHFQARS